MLVTPVSPPNLNMLMISVSPPNPNTSAQLSVNASRKLTNEQPQTGSPKLKLNTRILLIKENI